jgi:hypothetical protein
MCVGAVSDSVDDLWPGGTSVRGRLSQKDDFLRRWAVLWMHPSPADVDRAAETGGFVEHELWDDSHVDSRKCALLLYTDASGMVKPAHVIVCRCGAVAAVAIATKEGGGKATARHPHCFHLTQRLGDISSSSVDDGLETDLSMLFSVESVEERDQWVRHLNFGNGKEYGGTGAAGLTQPGVTTDDDIPGTDAVVNSVSPRSSEKSSDRKFSKLRRPSLGAVGRRLSIKGHSRKEMEAVARIGGAQDTVPEDEPGPTAIAAVKTGYLLKRGAHNTAYKRRWFSLCKETALLSYFKSDSTPKASGTVDVGGAMVMAAGADGGEEVHAFKIVTPFDKRQYVFAADDAATLAEWRVALATCGAVVMSAQEEAGAQELAMEVGRVSRGTVSAESEACTMEEFILARGGARESSLTLNKHSVLSVAGLVDDKPVKSLFHTFSAHALQTKCTPSKWGGLEPCTFLLNGHELQVQLVASEEEEEPKSPPTAGHNRLLQRAASTLVANVKEAASKRLGDQWESGGRRVRLEAGKHSILVFRSKPEEDGMVDHTRDGTAFALMAGDTPVFLVRSTQQSFIYDAALQKLRVTCTYVAGGGSLARDVCRLGVCADSSHRSHARAGRCGCGLH